MKNGEGKSKEDKHNFVKRTRWSQKIPFTNNTASDCTYGDHQMVNTEVRLTIFFAGKDGETLYFQQKQDLQLTVALIISSLSKNSGSN